MLVHRLSGHSDFPLKSFFATVCSRLKTECASIFILLGICYFLLLASSIRYNGAEIAERQITIWIRTPTAGFLIPPTTKAPRLTSHVFHAYITVYKRNIATNSSKFRSRQRISRTKFEKNEIHSIFNHWSSNKHKESRGQLLECRTPDDRAVVQTHSPPSVPLLYWRYSVSSLKCLLAKIMRINLTRYYAFFQSSLRCPLYVSSIQPSPIWTSVITVIKPVTRRSQYNPTNDKISWH